MGKRTIDRVLAIAEQKKLSQTTLAKRLGISDQVLTNWKARGMPPRWDRLVADQLGVSIDTLHGRNDPNNLFNVSVPPERANYQLLPEISWVAAGQFDEANDPYAPGAGSRLVETHVPVSTKAFALLVRGDSMEPEFPDGCTIIVDPAVTARSGDYIIARAEDWDQATFKQYRIDAGIKWLVSLNPKYPAIQAPYNSSIVGVVVEMIPARRRFR